MRIFIENKVSESMIRQCYQCNKRFYKNEGCNHIKCACGAEICYVCKQPIKGYTHFHNNPNGCIQFNDVAALHAEEMKKAYDEAVKIYKIQFPEDADINLKYDPKKLLDDLQSKTMPINNPPPNIPFNIMGVRIQFPQIFTNNNFVNAINVVRERINELTAPVPTIYELNNNRLQVMIYEAHEDSDSENTDEATTTSVDSEIEKHNHESDSDAEDVENEEDEDSDYDNDEYI